MEEKYQNKYQMNFHENSNCVVVNDAQFQQAVTIVAGEQPSFLNQTNQVVEVPVLETEQAEALWQIAMNRGWVDENHLPLLSQPKAAILASVMADALQLTPRWAAFEQLWGIPDLANKLSHALNCSYYADLEHQFSRELTGR